jgi:hypothetical protein
MNISPLFLNVYQKLPCEVALQGFDQNISHYRQNHHYRPVFAQF